MLLLQTSTVQTEKRRYQCDHQRDQKRRDDINKFVLLLQLRLTIVCHRTVLRRIHHANNVSRRLSILFIVFPCPPSLGGEGRGGRALPMSESCAR